MGNDSRTTVPALAKTTGPRRKASFRVKLSLIAVLVAAIPLVAVGLVVQDVNERALGDANSDLLDALIDNVDNLAAVTIDRADATLATVSAQLADADRDIDSRIALAKAVVASARTLDEVGIYDAQGERVDVIAVDRGGRTAPPTPLPPRLTGALIAPSGPMFGATTVIGTRAAILRVAPVVGAAQRWTVAAQVSLDPVAERIAHLGVASRHLGQTLLVVDTSLMIVADARGELVGRHATPAEAGVLTGVDGQALGNNVLVRGEFARADGERMLGAIRSIEGTPFAVIVETPRQIAYHSISAVRRIVLAAVLIAIALALVAGITLARRVTRPIKILVDYADDLAHRRFDRRVTIKARDELGVLGDALEAAATELAASDERIRNEVAIRTDLGRYLPVQLVDQIVARERDLSLGGERREITVMFADVVGFTPLAERQSAETVVTMLNELFTILTEIVFRHGGTVDKFLGDCVMAIWGAPNTQGDHARRAVAAAEDMLRWLEAGNDSWRERFGFTVELAIGINSGEAVVGNFGSETRMEYTAIGDVVNVAARLESIARPSQILVTRATTAFAGEGFTFRALGARALAGKSEPVELFEVIQ